MTSKSLVLREQTVPYVQIAAISPPCQYVDGKDYWQPQVYALDADGFVWEYDFDTKTWSQLGSRQIAEVN